MIYGQFQITAGKIYCLNQDQFKLNGEQLNSRNIIRNNTIRTTGAVSGIVAAAAAVASGTFKRIIIYFISFSSSDVIPHEPELSIDERALDAEKHLDGFSDSVVSERISRITRCCFFSSFLHHRLRFAVKTFNGSNIKSLIGYFA